MINNDILLIFTVPVKHGDFLVYWKVAAIFYVMR